MDVGFPSARKTARANGVATVFVMSLFTVIGLAGSASASELCGATITDDLKLRHDLACDEAGITVGADGVTIRLNGHTISGPDSHDSAISGIIVNGSSDVTIRGPGTIVGFFAGIRIVNSSDVEVKRLTVRGSHEAGIRLEGSTEVEIVRNKVFGHGHDAIQLRNSHGNVIKDNVAVAIEHPSGCAVNLVSSNDNLVAGNALGPTGTSAVQFGRITGFPPSSGNIIEDNELFDSTHGVRAFAGATGNVVVENEIFGNMNGISFIGPGDPALGNTYSENEIGGNTCGITGSSAELEGNTFVDNEFGGGDAGDDDDDDDDDDEADSDGANGSDVCAE